MKHVKNLVYTNMVLKTGKEYIDSLRALNPRVYVNGERIQSILENPVTGTVVRSNAKIYDLAHELPYRDIITGHSPYINDVVSRSLHICQNIEDLEKKVEMVQTTAVKLGTCNYRCVGCDALNALASVTYEMDSKLKTQYHKK